MHAFQVNHTAVLVSALMQWVLGWIWYGVIVRKSWSKLTGVTMGENKGNMILGMITSFVGSLVLSFILVHVEIWASRVDVASGASIGVVCWLGFMAPPLLIQHIYERRPVNLCVINAVYWLFAMALSGGLLAVWR